MDLFKINYNKSKSINDDSDIVQGSYDLDLMENIPELAIAIVNEKNQIIHVNNYFSQMFDDELVNLEWDEFIKISFNKETTGLSTPNIYRYKNDINNDYIIHTRIDMKTKYRYCWIHRIKSKTLLNIAKKRTSLMEQKRFDLYNCLENFIFQKSMRWQQSDIKLEDINYADEGYIYLKEDRAETIINDYIDFIYSIMNSKEVNSSARIKLNRLNNDLIISTEIDGFNYQVSDLHSTFKWKGKKTKLGAICRSIENLLSDIHISLTLKNRKNESSSLLFVELRISDLDGVKWLSKEEKIANV